MEVPMHKAPCGNEATFVPSQEQSQTSITSTQSSKDAITQRHRMHCPSNVFVIQPCLHITHLPPRERDHTYLSLFSLFAGFPKTAVPLSQLLIMSSSFSQLVLDFIIFAIIHYFIIFPLITKLLGLITGEHKPFQPSASVFDTLKTFINNEQEVEQQPSPTAAFTIYTIPEEAECEKCGIFLDQEACVTRISCCCTCLLYTSPSPRDS